jgi:cytochrome c5
VLRKRAVRWLFSASLAAFSSFAIAADETGIVLAEGEGGNQVQAACSMCHSLDYIVINSPFQDRSGWEKSVRKMVDVMGAPLTDEDIVVIVKYLARHYGDPLAAKPGP